MLKTTIQIYHYLNNCGVEDVEDVASVLCITSRDERNVADYKLDLDRFDVRICQHGVSYKQESPWKDLRVLLEMQKGDKPLLKVLESYKEKLDDLPHRPDKEIYFP